MFLLARTRGIVPALAMLVGSRAVTAATAGSGLVVVVPPVVHAGAPFSAALTLPPSVAIRRQVEVEALTVDGDGAERRLVKKKLSVSAGGEVSLQHQLDGLRIE